MGKKYLPINEKLEDLSCLDLEGDVDSVIQYLNRVKERYPNHTRLVLSADCGYEGYHGYTLFGTRPETEEERTHRLAQGRVARERKKEKAEALAMQERMEYERLKEKYG